MISEKIDSNSKSFLKCKWVLILSCLVLFHSLKTQEPEISELPSFVKSILGPKLNSKSECRNIKGLGSPVNIFRTYIQQTMNNFFVENSKAEVTLLYYRESLEQISTHRYIFAVRNVFHSKIEYIGIMSVIPPMDFDEKRYRQFVVRYINARNFDNVKALLGVHDAQADSQVPCSNMRDTLVKNIVENPVMPYTCFSEGKSSCLTKNNLKEVFRTSLEVTRRILAEFGFSIRLADLIFNRKLVAILKQSYQRFDFLRRDVAILEKEITSLTQVDHDSLLRTSYTGKERRCKDILDFRRKCGINGIRNCLNYSDGVKLRNFLIIYYMIDTRTVLKVNEIQSKFFINH